MLPTYKFLVNEKPAGIPEMPDGVKLGVPPASAIRTLAIVAASAPNDCSKSIIDWIWLFVRDEEDGCWVPDDKALTMGAGKLILAAISEVNVLRKFVTRNCESDTGSDVCARMVVRNEIFCEGVNSEISLGNGSVATPALSCISK